MNKKDKLVLFSKMIDDNYYFRCTGRRNRWEWKYDSDDHIVIYGDDPLRISGLDDIGTYAKALDLCCSVEFDFYTRRLEVNVH